MTVAPTTDITPDPPSGAYRVGIAGGSGYGGAETLRWVATHPRLEVCGLTSRTHAGKPVPAVHPNLAGFADDLVFVGGPEALLATEPDVVVMALPHRHAAAYAHALRQMFPELRIVDLSGDHRLGNSDAFRAAYGGDHPHPEELESGQWVYGLPEAHGDRIATTTVVANPGCFATGALLGALPLCRRGLVEGPVRHVAITGSSGSGAEPKATTHHPERTGDVKAYKVLAHQHVPEIVNCLAGHGLASETSWMMVPQSGPFARGIFTTLFFELRQPVPAGELRAIFEEEYADAPFVRMRDTTPRLGHVRGTNFCDVAVTVKGRHAVVLTAIDNLGKGMAGQAVQNINLMLGMAETEGLMVPGEPAVSTSDIDGAACRELEARHGIPTYNQLPLTLVRGEGCWVEDTAGRRFLDLYGGHAVALTGHCHPRVVEAIREQAGRLLFYSNLVSSDVRARMLRDLTDTAPDGVSRAFLCNSGAEANEAAIKLARKTTGRRIVVSMEGGFHGRTMGALSATSLGHYLSDYAPGVPGHRFVPFGDLEAARDAVGDDTASVLLEPIQSMGGMRTASDEYVRGLRALCDERGALLHFDEVQTGPARTGRWWFGDHAGVSPDLISTAKGLGSGVPVGAVLVADAVAEQVRHGDQGTTFGGGMLAAVAVSATLAVIREEGLLENATRRGRQIAEAARGLSGVTGIRGRGLLLGIELDRPAKDVVVALRERLVLTGTTPGDARVLRLLPPLVLGDTEVDRFLTELAAVLGG